MLQNSLTTTDIVFPLKHVLYFRAAERFLIRLKYLTKKARKSQ